MASTTRNKPGAEKIVVEDSGSSALDNLQVMYEKNKKPINTIAFVVIGAVVAFFAYKKLYQEPRVEKAATAMSYAQRYFETDSMSKALNGDGQRIGFLKIEKKFSGTPSANLAHFYAGIAYLKTGDFKNAIKQLEDFDGKGTSLEYAAYGSIADAYMETGDVKKGIEYYNKAAGNKEDFGLTPFYLARAGAAYEMNKQPEEAKKAYIRIRDEYPTAPEARNVDKYLARLGDLN
ncbi:tetratricopeptide repeat protein [Polluticoccus soli]|uniref:tetratricopeptide repeat protein n=1 Tax=Polluticoccus soli TaxID=3034150 RepID=UPI0023E0ABBE|nr:tetratricopeptide repeat protein [Flavipsychrobacter sp. JY13-12]